VTPCHELERVNYPLTGQRSEDEHAADAVGERCMIRHKRQLAGALSRNRPDYIAIC
jgi:hypothetical protein